MEKAKKIIMIGGSGLVGSRLKELLSLHYEVSSFSLETGVDITKPETLESLLSEAQGTVVLHLAAKADVDGCENDKPFGKRGAAWKINVLGTENVVRVCEKGGFSLLYISTDFVFDGEKSPNDGYTEADHPNPINWYATTKYEGEKRVLGASCLHSVLRIAYPYRQELIAKLDFVRAILTRLKTGQEVKAVTDHIMTPTYIDDIGLSIDLLIQNNATGIYHVVGSSSLSPYDAATAIANSFSIQDPHITKTTRAEFFKDRAPRPFNLTLKNDKIRQLGAVMKTFEEGLREISNS